MKMHLLIVLFLCGVAAILAVATSDYSSAHAPAAPSPSSSSSSSSATVAEKTVPVGDPAVVEKYFARSSILDGDLPGHPCDWCRTRPFHIWCKGWGGKGCAEAFQGSHSCEPSLRQLKSHCTSQFGKEECSMRCLHAAASVPGHCVNRTHPSARVVEARKELGRIATKCHLRRSNKWDSPPSLPLPQPLLVVLVHLQKTGGWSIVDYAKRAGLRCPPTEETCKVAHPEDAEALTVGDHHAQRAVLSAYASAFDFLHLEQTLNADMFVAPDVRFVTVLRHPIRRLLSHFRMGTKAVEIPGFWSGSPFERQVTLREFATAPVTDCPICKASRKGSVKKDKHELSGGVDYRHCCRKQWRYAADNYFTRELTGAQNLEMLGWGEVNLQRLQAAIMVLGKMDVVLVTEELHRAPEILHEKLGWPQLPMATLNTAPASKKNGAASPKGTSSASLKAEPEIAADPDVLGLLMKRNRYDLELYRRARRAQQPGARLTHDLGYPMVEPLVTDAIEATSSPHFQALLDAMPEATRPRNFQDYVNENAERVARGGKNWWQD